MAEGFTATEILLFSESRATLRSLVSTHDNLSPRVTQAILNEDACYQSWVADLANYRHGDLSVYSHILQGLFSDFVGPIFASSVIRALRSFCRRVARDTRFPRGVRLFRGYRFLDDSLAHVEGDCGMFTLVELIRTLAFAVVYFQRDFVVGADPADMIHTSLVTDAPAIAGVEAQKYFNNSLQNSLHIPYILNGKEKAQLKRELGMAPVYDCKTGMSNDHVVIASLRHAAREVHKKQHRLHLAKEADVTQGLKTLVVGAAFREVAEFSYLPNVHYYFANADAKDAARTSLEALRQVVVQKRKNLSARDKKVLAELKKNPKYTADMPATEAIELLKQHRKIGKAANAPVERLLTFQGLMREAEASQGATRPGSFKFAVNDYRKTHNPNDCYSVLLAQDWGYNASAVNWLELFARTSASVCYGYMCLPDELLFDNMPDSDLYKVRRFPKRCLWDKSVVAAPIDLSHRDSFSATVKDGVVTIDWATLTHAYSNGYSHPWATWSLLLRKPMLSHNSYDFALEVQLESRFGPMTVFSLTRVQKTASVTRAICLPLHRRYVRLLDLPKVVEAMVTNKAYPVSNPLPYFSVNAAEFYTTLCYAQALDLKSLTKTNLAAFVKVHRAGASLVTKELSPEWSLQPQDVFKFVHVVYYHAVYLATSLGEDVSSVVGLFINWKDRVRSVFNRGMQAMMNATVWMWSWMMTEGIAEKLVILPPDEFHQEGVSGLTQQSSTTSMFDKDAFVDSTNFTPHVDLTSSFCAATLMPADYTIDDWLKEDAVVVKAVYREHKLANPDGPSTVLSLRDPDLELMEKFSAGYRIKTDGDLHSSLLAFHKAVKTTEMECPMCIKIDGKCGDQIVDCMYDSLSRHTIRVTLAEINELRENLREQAKEAPPNLAQTLHQAMEAMPKCGFEHTVQVEYIKGGPGTGKSRLIRELADNIRDLVVAPFQKLRVDYKDQMVGTELTSWEFHTHHRAMTIKNREVVYFDEFTAIPYLVFAIIAYNCQAKTIVLVGDEQQTGVLEGNNEGEPISKRIDLASVSKHNLLCNFRNPVDDVRRVNYLFGTRMIPMSRVKTGLIFDKLANLVEATGVGGSTLMHYSWETKRDIFGDIEKEKKTSVRCNQGSTHPKVALALHKHDSKLIADDKLNFVALTRHRDELKIMTDEVGAIPVEIQVFLDRIKNVPEIIHADDYVSRLFFGVENAEKGYSYELGPITKRFIAIVKSVGGFEPAGKDVDAYTCISQEEVVEPLRERVTKICAVEEPAPIAVSVLLKRKNNCLVLAVAAAMSLDVHHLHTMLLASSWYRMWLITDQLSTREDCEQLALALSIVLTVHFVGRVTASNWRFAPPGATASYVIHHTDNSAGGHFYCLEATSTWAVEAQLATISKVSKEFSDTKSQESYDRPEVTLEMVGWSDTGSSVVSVTDEEKEVASAAVQFVMGLRDTTTTAVQQAGEGLSSALEMTNWSDVDSPASVSVTTEEVEMAGAVVQTVRNLGKVVVDTATAVAEWAKPTALGEPYAYLDASSSGSKSDGFNFSAGAQVADDQQEAFANNYGLRTSFVDYATTFIPKLQVSYLMPTTQDLLVCRQANVRRVHPISDAYRLTTAYEFPSIHSMDLPYLNHEMSNVVGSKFVTGMLNMEVLFPTNQRRHPKSQVQKFRTLGGGPALMYFQRNSAQQLQVLQARYLSRRAADAPTFKRTQLACKIANLFVDECMEPNLAAVMTDENLYRITSRAFMDMVTKHYEKQMTELNTVNARVYRFQLKDIEKPFKDAVVDLGKAGQGILAWSKEAHVMFMLVFRVLNDAVLKAMKPWVVYDNSMSEEQFMDKVNYAMSLTPDCAVNSVIDATACDSGQNGFTQEIERQIYARLGASDFMLDWYFSFRQRYILQSEHVRAHLTNVKTSGEPGTLLGNSILMAAVLNALVRGQGPFVLVTKGDDGFKRQANPRYDAEMLMGIKSFCPLDFKIDIDVPITFCGYALVEGSLFPDIQRKLAKVATHRFRDYKHFAEYQISLRDWLKRLPTDGHQFMNVMAVNASLSGRTVEQVEHMLMQIQSFAHIGPRQFDVIFPERTVEFEPPPALASTLPESAIRCEYNTVFVPMDNYLKRKANKAKALAKSA